MAEASADVPMEDAAVRMGDRAGPKIWPGNGKSLLMEEHQTLWCSSFGVNLAQSHFYCRQIMVILKAWVWSRVIKAFEFGVDAAKSFVCSKDNLGWVEYLIEILSTHCSLHYLSFIPGYM